VHQSFVKEPTLEAISRQPEFVSNCLSHGGRTGSQVQPKHRHSLIRKIMNIPVPWAVVEKHKDRASLERRFGCDPGFRVGGPVNPTTSTLQIACGCGYRGSAAVVEVQSISPAGTAHSNATCPPTEERKILSVHPASIEQHGFWEHVPATFAKVGPR